MASTADAKLTKAIESLADKITSDIKADDALKYTQAALNAANTATTLVSKDKAIKGHWCYMPKDW